MRKSYVCMKKEEGTENEHYAVGYYHSEQGWETESVHSEASMATNRMNYLNGGNGWLISYLEERLQKLETLHGYEEEEMGAEDATLDRLPGGRRKELRHILMLLKGEGKASGLSRPQRKTTIQSA